MPQESTASSGSSSTMVEPPSQRLTNEDFRKLLMTPRATPSSNNAAQPGSIREAMAKSSKKTSMGPPSERNEARRKKKNFYAALKKQEDNKLAELSEKYRDRARERRDGINPDYQTVETPGHGNSAYRAVAPDLKSGIDAAERRRRMIQESKFLGGDMEHTHLVKGLDYALLQKVRSEIQTKEQEEEQEMEKLAEEEAQQQQQQQIQEKEKPEEKLLTEGPEFKSTMGRNIHNIITIFRSRQITRNELFAPGRMAYVIDLDDENNETDIPTTLIRSKAEVPVSSEGIQTLTTNDIVINKLAQILSYLRAGGRGKKNKKRDKDKPLFVDNEDGKGGVDNDCIYDDVGEYKPERRKDDSSKYSRDKNESNSRDRNRDRGRDKYRDYKEKDDKQQSHNDKDHRDRSDGYRKSRYFDKPAEAEPEYEIKTGNS